MCRAHQVRVARVPVPDDRSRFLVSREGRSLLAPHLRGTANTHGPPTGYFVARRPPKPVDEVALLESAQ